MKNRIIKFRAYDKKKKKWLFDYKELGGFNLIGEITLVEGLREVPLGKWQDIEIQQFTGLLDKNGKEIYEGDIVVDTYKDNILEKIIVEMTPEFYHHYVEYGIGFPYYKVIGNIYENKDLLK